MWADVPPADHPPLRFKPGDRVRCRTARGYAAATVARCWHREPGSPPAHLFCYLLATNKGGPPALAPVDSRVFVIGADEAEPTQEECDADALFDLGCPEDASTRRWWQSAGYSGLHLTCMDGTADAATLRLLLRRPLHRPDVPAGPRSETPLMIAAQHANVQCAELLLAAGANPVLQNGEGRSAVQLVAQGTPSSEVPPGAEGRRRKVRVLLTKAVLQVWDDHQADEASEAGERTAREAQNEYI